ncbi:MAG: GNAT family N-acetyltransferase [Myxococcales bacterium]|nr:GNAT family N-acetyltransferase [Myxococcales bacterium]
MAALISSRNVHVRAAQAGEGRQVAGLWRELWEAHEGWGGYAATRDERAYAQLAIRLDEDARIRGGHPLLGRHVHLVAAIGDDLVGQVEGWLERQGEDAETPLTCEVRSLVVTKGAREGGLARALLAALSREARTFSGGAPVLLAAEVLDPNPAQAFYEHLGFRPVSWSTRIATERRGRGRHDTPIRARAGTADDAVAIALLETVLAGRRRRAKDARFDRPRALDAALASAIALHLSQRPTSPFDPVELVADDRGRVRGNACFVTNWLDYPFAPARRAILGRIVLDPAEPEPLRLLEPIVVQACRHAITAEAPTMEITDLDGPGGPLYTATQALGARPWSRIMLRAY